MELFYNKIFYKKFSSDLNEDLGKNLFTHISSDDDRWWIKKKVTYHILTVHDYTWLVRIEKNNEKQLNIEYFIKWTANIQRLPWTCSTTASRDRFCVELDTPSRSSALLRGTAKSTKVSSLQEVTLQVEHIMQLRILPWKRSSTVDERSIWEEAAFCRKFFSEYLIFLRFLRHF